MATRDQIVEAVKREYERFRSEKPAYCYNTGYDGKYTTSTESASMDDFEYAAKELKTKVDADYGSRASVRTAKSFSGEGQNQWSILIEAAGKAQPVFNFHMAIA